jgi:3'-5' exoribonuclease
MSSKPTHPPVIRLSDLKHGERGTFFVVLAERTRAVTQGNKPYYTCRFKDLRRTATYMVWLDGPYFSLCESDWQPGHFFKVQAVYTDHGRYGPQIDIEKIRPVEDRDAADGFDPIELVERPRFDPDELLRDLLAFIQTTISDPPLRRLAHGLIERHGASLKRLPAHEKRFYPHAGGWLEHVLSVAHTAAWLADYYRDRYADLKPPVNKDLVVAGAVLHDIGRATELKPGAGPLDPAEPTVEGRLFGHLFLGRDMVRDAAREQGDVNPELLRLLEHMVVTHLALPEWGSPRLPSIPEVLILHHADDLDAKMDMFARCLIRDASAGPFTERDPFLGRPLLKAREV